MRRILLITALFVLALVSPASASYIFDGDLETGDLSQFPLVQNCNNARALVYDSSNPGLPAPAEGTYALRLQANYTDYWTGPGDQTCVSSDPLPNPPWMTRRSQVASSALLDEGEVYYQSFYVYIASNFPTAVDGSSGSKFFLFQEDFGTPFNGSPPMDFGIKTIGGVQSFMLEQLDYSTNTDIVRWSTPITKGAWHRFVIRKKWSVHDLADGGSVSGFIDLKYDGTIQTFSSGDRGTALWGGGNTSRLYAPTLDPNQTNGSYRMYLNDYYGGEIPSSAAIPQVMFDGARIVTTLAEAES